MNRVKICHVKMKEVVKFAVSGRLLAAKRGPDE
jgi:hypothetical protein